MRISLILFITTVISSNILMASSVKGQQMEKVQVEIELKGESLTDAFKKIERQTPFTFLYRNEDVVRIKTLYLADGKITVSMLLEKLLAGTSLTFKQSEHRIVINRTQTEKPTEVKNEENLYLKTAKADSAGTFILTGKVLETKTGLPLPNATIISTLGRTFSDSRGVFKILTRIGTVLKISSVAFETLEVTIKGSDNITVSLKENEQAMKEVVINGLFTRKAESFTGSVATFSGKELKRVGNINVLQSLAVLDPSFKIIDNLSFGSDPNRIPEVVLRGATGIPDVSLNATYSNAPNLPLFILDGFETTVQRVYDLNMNMVASITLLKDASAKAIYGSKAGNGVVVIETLKPAAGELRISYTGSMDFNAPDLSSYHLTNSMQKIQAETLGGKYTSNYPELQYPLTQQYAANLQQALSGVDSYWLAQPLQNGIGQKQNLYLDGGTEAMRYAAGLNYNRISGVMKGSDRAVIAGVVNLQYRKKNISFSNSLNVEQNKAVNSPYGLFSDYAKMNPYWRIHDDNGSLIPSYPVGGSVVYNPLYDASLHTKNETHYTNIVNNFYVDWEAKKNLRFTARLGVSNQTNSSDYFLPGTASKYFYLTPASSEYLNRGEYTVTNGKSTNLSSDLTAAYSFTFGKSQVFSNLIYSVQQMTKNNTGFTMVGFPNDKLDDVSFGKQYLAGSKAVGSENTDRNMGVTSAVNYSYDNRLLADLSFRANASSQFGANKRWGNFWSAGLGWNIHHEKFMRSVTFVDQLKLRGSVGTSGTQNFSSYQSIASYVYTTDQTYNGDLGLKLLALANPDLKWQQVMDKNIGIDANIFKRINVKLDYYISDTKDLLADQTLAPSAGFDTYKENIGETRNQGYQLNLNTKVYSNPQSQTYIAIFGNIAHNSNKIRKVSNALKQLNEQKDRILNGTVNDLLGTDVTKPATRFAEGESISAIWAVPSLGIDPANGKEIFVKRDGSQTYLWNAADQVVVGDVLAKYNGTFGANIQYKALSVNFAFAYRIGGQLYNSTLVDKIENADINYNVDVRVLEDRWRTPGQQSFFKDIADKSDTKPTSRFVQDNNELIFSSVNLSYDFSKMKFVKALKMNSMSATLNANELGRIGNIKTERGLDYPFARTISLSLQANF